VNRRYGYGGHSHRYGRCPGCWDLLRLLAILNIVADVTAAVVLTVQLAQAGVLGMLAGLLLRLLRQS
jgi:hypothetical protein